MADPISNLSFQVFRGRRGTSARNSDHDDMRTVDVVP